MTSSDRRHDLIVAPLPDLCAELAIPGATVAVIDDGVTTTATAGVVNTRTGLPVTTDAVFQIQSITKVWTATLVMQLVDDGRVDLDDPVALHVPGFRTADAVASSRITVRQLLTHTGGFEGDDWRSTTDDDSALERYVTELVTTAPQHLPPGERFSYCSTGIAVLGRLVEIARELPFPRALRRHLAEPLGLDEFAVNAAEALGYRAAIGHVDGRPLRSWTYMPESNHPAGAQLSMSARALAEFGRLHLADGVAANGTRVLSAEAARAMRRAWVPVPLGDTQQGLGWQVDPASGLVFHSGGSLGVAAHLVVAPESGVVVAVAINGGDYGKLVRRYVDPILSELAGAPPRAVAAAPPDVDAELATERYVGRYALRTGHAVVEADHVGRLWLTGYRDAEAATLTERAGQPVRPDGPKELRRVDGDVFAVLAADGTVSNRVEFLGDDDTDRARFLYSSARTHPRLD